jgi:hypothetical protein
MARVERVERALSGISVARHALDQILCMLTTLFEIPEIRVGSESVTRDVPR